MDDDDRQIEPLSMNVLANLTIEELEERLELQLLMMPEGGSCIINYCGADGNCGANACPTDCLGNASCTANAGCNALNNS